MTESTIRSRGGFFGIGPILVSMLFALAICFILWPALNRHQKYSDPVVGNITWSNIDKGRDLQVVFLYLAVAIALSLGITVLCRRIAPLGPETDLGRSLNKLLLFSLVPAAWRLTVGLVNTVNMMPPVRLLSLFPLGVVTAIFLCQKYRDQLTPPYVLTMGGVFVLAPLMAAFSGMAIILAASRLVVPNVVFNLQPFVGSFAVCCAATVVGVNVAIFVRSRNIIICQRRLLRCLHVCQYPLPLLLFYLLPPPLIDATHQFRDPYPTRLAITLGAFACGSVGLMYRRFQAITIDQKTALTNAIAPSTVAALMIFVFCGTYAIPSLPHDYFHNGEQMLPWQQLWDFHQRPYVDFVPIHGAMDLFRGAANQLFFDGTAANFQAGDVLLTALATAAIAFAACELVTPLAALILLFTCLPTLDRLYFVAPPLFVIAIPRLLRKPALWLFVWLLMAALACAYNAAMGPAFVLGTLPVVLWQLYRGWRTEPKRILIVIASVVAACVLVVAVSPLREVALGFVKFILENQWTNEAGNGIAWAQGRWQRDHDWGYGTSQFLWETFRFSWILVVIGAAIFCWRELCKAPDERRIPAIVLAGSIPPVLLLSSLWVVERIDPGSPSRSGPLSQTSLYFLVPGLVFLTLSKKHPGRSVLLLSIALGLVYPEQPTGLDPDLIVQKPSAIRQIEAGASLLDGDAIGLPKIGQVIRPDPNVSESILSLKKDLAGLLKPHETFLDLTNETALYYYLDMPCPAPYAAYVAANAELQATMMRQLMAHPVPVALIAPSTNFDGGPLSLRCYRVYHDYTMTFAAVARGEYIFLVDPARVPEAGPVGSEAQLLLLDTAFKCKNLFRVPDAWGESWSAMRNRFDLVAKIEGTSVVKISDSNQPQSVSWNIPPAVTAGSVVDFLRFHFDFVSTDVAGAKFARQVEAGSNLKSKEPEMALTWTTQDGKNSAPILFNADPGDLVVPLGSYPRWLLGKHPRSFALTLLNPKCATQFTVSDLEFLHLQPM